jgi:hypothetical protein
MSRYFHPEKREVLELDEKVFGPEIEGYISARFRGGSTSPDS